MFKPYPVTLQRGALRLDPMVEADVPELAALAEVNSDLLRYMDGPLRPDWYRQAINEQREDKALPFTIRLSTKIVGTTRLGDFLPSLPACEIGWTWLEREQCGTGLNSMIKYLLLKHAFENCGMVRVQMKTAASNERSQRALEKIGARQEGVLRNHRRLAGGKLDDSVIYSITDHDWPEIKAALEAQFLG